MKIAVSAGIFAAFIGAVAAQSPVYGQCGGQGWTGPTTCASGSTCTYSNPYYSQCVPGGSGGGAPSTSAPASTTKTASSTSSAPSSTSTSTIDTTSHCGQYEQVTVGPYLLYTDLWGESGASSGSQCSQLISLSGTTVSWKTTWTWTGGTGVKSFSNIAAQQGLNKQLSAIKSIPSTWKWSQTSSGSITADVAYDLFTSNTAGGSNVNEIMIWMANYNAGPISATYGSNGQPTPVATNVSLGGQTWNLYFGSNGSNNVYSFLPATSGTTITSFSADLNLFLQYLTAHQGVSTSQYLVTAQAGTEPTVGSATLTTSAYSLVIN